MKSHLSLALMLIMVAAGLEARQTPLVQVPVTSTRYESLQNEALRFFRAVRNGDKPTLVRLTPASGRDGVRKDLDDPTSSLARLLLTGSRAMRGRFMGVQTPRLTMLRQSETREADDRVLVCYSDSRQAFKTPATTADLPVTDSNRAEMCLPFVYGDRQWQVVLTGR